ncbi:DUF3320 domain-containing protein [Rhodococcoides yunnanense]|uniref:DUF3320 domain-containing protein n=1 Tax=Rhodococcoides yunnanense TaxID=278209 RepID=UPI00147272CB
MGSSAPREWTAQYVAVEHSTGGTRDIKTPEGRLDAKRFFEEVISVESPVHADILYERFRSAWGVARLGAAIKPEVDRAMNRASPYGADERGFYRSGSINDGVVRVPAQGQGIRKLTHVSTEELSLAVCRTVQESVTVDDKNLISQVVEVFGGQRVSAESKTLMSEIIDSLINEGLIARDSLGPHHCDGRLNYSGLFKRGEHRPPQQLPRPQRSRRGGRYWGRCWRDLPAR